MKISNTEILHLLLATKDHYLLLLENFEEDQLETKISSSLDQLFPLKTHEFKINIYYSVYSVVK
jgi:hypothetical protein